jgi:GT2 family glycosyltransferase
VALNNDTLVPPGWLTGLLRHLNDRRVGLVGPTTNAAPNEAQVEAPYTVYGSFEAFAEQRARQYAGRQIDVSMLTMFCLAMRRETYEELGPLDERFEVGLFEDDDYSRRAHAAGMQVVCAEDVFVHHFGEASFGELVPSGEYAALFERNRQRFEQKWGDAWQAHQRRRSSTYESLIARIRSLAERAVPEEATVLVLSKGDTLLLQLGERRVGWHFPRLADGTYAGYYPADGGEAIAQLEQLRTAGADHLVVPATSLWWLDHYPEFGQHLEQHYALLVHEPETGSIYFVGRRRDQ